MFFSLQSADGTGEGVAGDDMTSQFAEVEYLTSFIFIMQVIACLSSHVTRSIIHARTNAKLALKT